MGKIEEKQLKMFDIKPTPNKQLFQPKYSKAWNKKTKREWLQTKLYRETIQYLNKNK